MNEPENLNTNSSFSVTQKHFYFFCCFSPNRVAGKILNEPKEIFVYMKCCNGKIDMSVDICTDQSSWFELVF